MRKSDPAKILQQRERIMRAALKCFTKKGIQGTSTDDICRAAKISSGTLYYYFKSRDGLLHDLVVHAHAARDPLLRKMQDHPDLIEASIAAQSASKELIEAQGMPIEVYLELLLYAQRNKKLKQAFEDAAVQVHAMLCEAVRVHQAAGKLPSDVSAEALAVFLEVVATGTSIIEMVNQDLLLANKREVIAAIFARNRGKPAPPVEPE